MSPNSKTFDQLTKRLQTALVLHQGMHDEWIKHMDQMQQRRKVLGSSRLTDPANLAHSVQQLLSRAELLSARLEAVMKKGVPNVEPINVMHRLTDLVADMVGPETRAHRLKRAIRQMNTLVDIREESAQELEEKIALCLSIIGDSLSELWQG